ncbi:MAG: hypothetical protein ACRDQB_13275 [Thermocrispum sp.]
MTVRGGDAERPAAANGSDPGGQSGDEQRKVRKLRVAGYALLVVAVLAALVPVLGLAAEAPSTPERAAAESSNAAEQTTTKKTRQPRASKAEKKQPKRTSAEPEQVGPVIDTDSNERADAAQTRRKLIVGGVALGLLVIVLWGRRARSLRRKSKDTQSTGRK